MTPGLLQEHRIQGLRGLGLGFAHGGSTAGLPGALQSLKMVSSGSSAHDWRSDQPSWLAGRAGRPAAFARLQAYPRKTR